MPSVGVSPEFLGIYLFYLESKVIAWRTVTVLLVITVCTLVVYCTHVEIKLMNIRYDIEEGNSVKCDPGYASKIVDGSKVTCIMQRVGVGVVTRSKRVR